MLSSWRHYHCPKSQRQSTRIELEVYDCTVTRNSTNRTDRRSTEDDRNSSGWLQTGSNGRGHDTAERSRRHRQRRRPYTPAWRRQSDVRSNPKVHNTSATYAMEEDRPENKDSGARERGSGDRNGQRQVGGSRPQTSVAACDTHIRSMTCRGGNSLTPSATCFIFIVFIRRFIPQYASASNESTTTIQSKTDIATVDNSAQNAINILNDYSSYLLIRCRKSQYRRHKFILHLEAEFRCR